MAKALAHFTITRIGDDYLLGLEDEDGETSEFTADLEQLDLIVEAIEELGDEDDTLALDEDEEAPEE